jgi:carboxypeptidase family protein
MRLCTKAVWSLPAILCLLTLLPATVVAQTVTTGNMTGVITDAQGGVLPGAAVLATHTPTGTTYDSLTDGNGRYRLLNVQNGNSARHSGGARRAENH